jgi:hypothetical protein
MEEVYCVRNVVAYGRGSEGETGEWSGVASTLTQTRNLMYPALLTLMRTPRLPAVDWTDSPADLNGLVRLGERRNVVSARVPSGSARALQHSILCTFKYKKRVWVVYCYTSKLWSKQKPLVAIGSRATSPRSYVPQSSTIPTALKTVMETVWKQNVFSCWRYLHTYIL